MDGTTGYRDKANQSVVIISDYSPNVAGTNRGSHPVDCNASIFVTLTVAVSRPSQSSPFSCSIMVVSARLANDAITVIASPIS